MTPPLARLEQAIVAGAQYALRVAMSVDVAGTKPPAVLAVTYLDAQGCVLEGPAEGFLPSPQFGLYRYLGRADQTGDVTERVTLVPPAGAAHARLTVHVWQTAQVRMRAEPRIALVPLGGQSPAQAGSISIRLLACADTDVAPGDGILVRVRFAPGTVLEPRAALATVQAFDADGAALPLGDQVPVSDAVGPFRYLKPLDTASSGGGSGAADQVWAGFGMTLPKGTHRLAVQVLRWITEHPLHVQEIVFAPPAGPILAQGSTDVTDRTEVRFCATLRPHRINSGAPMAMLEAQVLDAYGQELDAPIAGLVRQEALWPNIRWRQPGPGHKQRGHNAPPPAPVGEVLLLPEGAARLHWRLRAASDAPDLAVDLVGAPMVQDTTTDPMDQLAAIPWATDRPTGRLDLPNTLFDAAAAGRVSLLGGAHRVTGPGWLRVTAHITQEGASKDAPPKTGLPPGTVQIWPWVRHAHTGWGTPPPSGLITGLDGILVADVQPVDTTGKVEATLLLPPETTEVLILAFSHMDLAATGWSCGALALHPARPDAVTLIH
ncbi:MAG: hypothetical protein ACPGVS_06085, partial [Primorskyibacter sp.]